MRRLVSDALWAEVEPLLPKQRPHPKGGRPYASDRACLSALIFIDQSGVPYNLLPAEAFGVSGPTCWRRLRDWTRAGV